MKRKPEPADGVAEKLVEVLARMRMTHGEGIEAVVLADLAAGRHGWYHETVCCYIDEAQIAEHGRIAAMRAARRLKIELPEEVYL